MGSLLFEASRILKPLLTKLRRSAADIEHVLKAWAQRRLRLSISQRVTLTAGVVVLAFVLLTATALDRAFRASAMANLNQRLQGQLFLLMSVTEWAPQTGVNLPDALPEPALTLPDSGLYAVVSHNRQVLWQSPSWVGQTPPAMNELPAGVNRLEVLEQNGRRWYGLHYGVRWASNGSRQLLTFHLLEDAHILDSELQRYRHTLWLWLGGLGALLLLMQFLLLAWGLRPLQRLARSIRALERGDVEKIEGRYPPELRHIADNVNALIAVEHARQTRFERAVGDLAHSLKTPIAVLQGLAHQPMAEWPHELNQQLQRMQGMVQHHLQRARTRGAGGHFSGRVPLRPCALSLTQSLNRVYAAKKIRFDVQIAEDLALRINQGDLYELLGNLADNAAKWCIDQVQIGAEVLAGAEMVVGAEGLGSAEAQPKGLRLWVADDGAGIAPEQQSRLLQRGERADESTPGHGLGLSIVQDIALAYQGQLRIGTSIELEGAEFSLYFPATMLART